MSIDKTEHPPQFSSFSLPLFLEDWHSMKKESYKLYLDYIENLKAKNALSKNFLPNYQKDILEGN